MKNRHLFLFGGSPPFTNKLGKQFSEIALKFTGKVVILFLEREGWEKYMPKYTSVLENNGIDEFGYLPLRSKPNGRILEILASCKGIVICGGETELYRNYIVDTLIGKRIKDLYHQGVPIAGFSAGALISPSYCVIPPIDNLQNKQLFLEGLGLIKDCIISVHYTKWNEEENLKAALKKTNVPIGYGIDDEAAVYFKNESVKKIEGENVYKLEK